MRLGRFNLQYFLLPLEMVLNFIVDVGTLNLALT
jgi:hypothetical protein